MMMCNGDMMGGMWWLAGGLFWLLVLGGGALVVWAVIRGSGTGGSRTGGQDDRSLAILRERFARGELSESEYREARKTLDEE